MTRARLVSVAAAGLLCGLLSLPGAAQNDANPYGFSVWGYQGRVTASGIKWVRLQRDWSSIETAPGVYDFSGLDADVAAANAAGVHATVPIQDAPDFRKTQVCNGVNLFPGANEMATFAGLLAARYNGQNGHGYIDSFEIGNEEWDGYWGGSWAATLPCRSASYYGPVLKAGYQAVKAQLPTALVGMFGMWWVNTPHIQGYLTWLYQNGYGADMDFANFHYYTGADPSVTNGDTPSFDLEWQTIRGVQAAYNDGAKPVWCTEIGWSVSSVSQSGPIVSLAQQSQYLQYALDSARTSKVMQRMFIYTISDTGSDGMNLYPVSGPLPSYTMLEGYIGQYPSWVAPSPAPTATPTPAPVPTPTPTPTPSPIASPTPSPSASPTASPGPQVAAPAVLTSAAESVVFSPTGKTGRCRKGTVTATGSFTTNGSGGLVTYAWVRSDNRGSVTVAEPAITVASGDSASHAVAADRWSPNSSGSEQLVFLWAGAPTLVSQAFTCG
jgi:cell division septation protein DedD